VLPAVPALALLCAPYLEQVASRRGAQRAMFVLASVVGAVCVLALLFLILRPDQHAAATAAADIDPIWSLALIAIASAVVCAIASPFRSKRPDWRTTPSRSTYRARHNRVVGSLTGWRARATPTGLPYARGNQRQHSNLLVELSASVAGIVDNGYALNDEHRHEQNDDPDNGDS